jgi:hypothetical protein
MNCLVAKRSGAFLAAVRTRGSWHRHYSATSGCTAGRFPRSWRVLHPTVARRFRPTKYRASALDSHKGLLLVQYQSRGSICPSTPGAFQTTSSLFHWNPGTRVFHIQFNKTVNRRDHSNILNPAQKKKEIYVSKVVPSYS